MTEQLGAWLFGEQTNQTWTRLGAVMVLISFGGGSLFGLTSIQVPDSAAAYWWLPLIYLFVPMIIGIVAGIGVMYHGSTLARDRYRIEQEAKAKFEMRSHERVPLPRSDLEDQFMLAFGPKPRSPDQVRAIKLTDLSPRDVLMVLAKLQTYRGLLTYDGEVYARALPQDVTVMR